MRRVMVDRVFGDATAAVVWIARVRIDVEVGKVAACDINAQPMARLEEMRRLSQVPCFECQSGSISTLLPVSTTGIGQSSPVQSRT